MKQVPHNTLTKKLGDFSRLVMKYPEGTCLLHGKERKSSRDKEECTVILHGMAKNSHLVL